VRPEDDPSDIGSCVALPDCPAQTRTVQADVSRVIGPHTTVSLRVIGAGRANEGLRADWQEQLATVQREIGIQYIRMHGILNDDMGVYAEDSQGNPQYNFHALMHFTIRCSNCTSSRLPNSRYAVQARQRTVFWWKGNITPPKDPARWSDLIRAFTAHMKMRYGEDEIGHRYFEVWREPDLLKRAAPYVDSMSYWTFRDIFEENGALYAV
jgi:xylan 1,4-beta-xylosidase